MGNQWAVFRPRFSIGSPAGVWRSSAQVPHLNAALARPAPRRPRTVREHPLVHREAGRQAGNERARPSPAKRRDALRPSPDIPPWTIVQRQLLVPAKLIVVNQPQRISRKGIAPRTTGRHTKATNMAHPSNPPIATIRTTGHWKRPYPKFKRSRSALSPPLEPRSSDSLVPLTRWRGRTRHCWRPWAWSAFTLWQPESL